MNGGSDETETVLGGNVTIRILIFTEISTRLLPEQLGGGEFVAMQQP